MSPGESSFYATALHEVLHGLGFGSLLSPAGTWYGDRPTLFDMFLGYQVGETTLSFMDLSQAELAEAYISNAVFWTGANGNAGNPAGVPVQIFAPDPADEGSSLSHIDPDVSPESLLMYPAALPGLVENFTFSAMELGMLRDIQPAAPRRPAPARPGCSPCPGASPAPSPKR